MADSIDGGYTYSQLEEIVNFIKGKIDTAPNVAVICGSGLGPLADALEGPIEIKYGEIPNFPQSTVEGHSGSLIFGTTNYVPVVVMKGRFHFYEGYPLYKVTMPIKVFKMLGCTYLIVTNAAGGINQKYKVGDIMLIKDHVNFIGNSGNNPLRGPHDKKFGDRFPAINKCYDESLQKYAIKTAQKLGLQDKLHSGVYVAVGGPNYETIAEMKMFAMLGIDAVGMSTVPEVLVAKNCGLSVFAFSLITNEGILEYTSKKKPNHLEVLAAAKSMEQPLQEFVKEIIKFMGSSIPCNCGGKGNKQGKPCT